MPWLELLLRVHQADVTLVEQALQQLGALAITLRGSADQQDAVLEPAPGQQPLWRQVKLQALFEPQNASALEQALRQQLGRDLLVDFHHQVLADREWTRAWMDHFQPMQFGRRLWIYPRQDRQPDHTDMTVVYLDPGLAFGTGSHPTTALCLSYLDSQDMRDLCVLDYGCGSGILAVAALKLGAADAIAVDHDPQALEATRGNAAYNDCAQRLQTCLPTSCPTLSADLCLANILAKPLIELAPKLLAATRIGGTLVLSGMLPEQVAAVAAAYLPYSEQLDCRHQDGWSMLCLRRHGNGC